MQKDCVLLLPEVGIEDTPCEKSGNIKVRELQLDERETAEKEVAENKRRTINVDFTDKKKGDALEHMEEDEYGQDGEGPGKADVIEPESTALPAPSIDSG